MSQSKANWKTIESELRARILSGEFAPGARMPSDAALAEEWKVSRPTAHRALAELQRLGLVVRNRGAGTIVAEQNRSKTGRVALVFDLVARQFSFPHSDMITGIQEGLGDDYNLLWCDSKGDPVREADYLHRMLTEADGVICVPSVDSYNLELYNEWSESHRPLVYLDRLPAQVEGYAVMSDNRQATYRAVKALMDRGHRHIGFISFFKPHFSTVTQRFDSYQQALADHNNPFSTTDIRWLAPELERQHPSVLMQNVSDALIALTRRDDPVTAIFCVQDLLAKSAIICAEELKIEIPNQLEIATFNDWPPMMLGRPWDIHRVVPRSHEIGLAAGTKLLQLIHAQHPIDRVTEIVPEFFPADAGLVSSSDESGGIGSPFTNQRRL